MEPSFEGGGGDGCGGGGGGGSGGGGRHAWVVAAMRSPSECYKIGDGAASQVYAVRHPETGTRVAVKRMHRGALSHDATKLHSFQKEVDLFSKLHHPNIIRLLDVCHCPDAHLLVLELAECELADELQDGPLSEVDARGYFRQVAEATQYCHNMSVCHRDLKLENVMLVRIAFVLLAFC